MMSDEAPVGPHCRDGSPRPSACAAAQVSPPRHHISLRRRFWAVCAGAKPGASQWTRASRNVTAPERLPIIGMTGRCRLRDMQIVV